MNIEKQIEFDKIKQKWIEFALTDKTIEEICHTEICLDEIELRRKLRETTEAKEFVERTGCDSLAIAIGTSHGAYKFKGRYSPSHFGSFRFHRKRIVMGTAGDPVFIDCIIDIFEVCSCVQRYVCFGEMAVLSESITGEKVFVKLYSIESSITKKCSGIDQRVL